MSAYLYQLVGGLSIYGAPRGSNPLVFDATKAVFIAPDQRGTKIQRADKGGAKPTTVYVPVTAVVLYHDVTDPELLAAIGSELSGLVLPIGPRRFS